MRWPGDHRGGFTEMVQLVTIFHQLTLSKFCVKRISLLLNIVDVKKNFYYTKNFYLKFIDFFDKGAYTNTNRVARCVRCIGDQTKSLVAWSFTF